VPRRIADPVGALGLRLQCDNLALVWFSRCSLSAQSALAKVRQLTRFLCFPFSFRLETILTDTGTN